MPMVATNNQFSVIVMVANSSACSREDVCSHELKVTSEAQTYYSVFVPSYMSHLLLLGKFEYGGGPIFKVVLEC